MTSRNSMPIVLLAVIIVIVFLGIMAYWVVSTADKSRYEIPVLGEVPEFQFTDQDGRPFGLNDMLGKICVVDFGFTRCKGPCPVMASRYSELYNLYKGSDLVQLIYITIDPDYDSLSVLKRYAEQNGVTDNRWVFLRSSIDSVVEFSEKGLSIGADKATLPGGHSTRFILIDTEGQIRSYHQSLDDDSFKKLKSNINRLAKES